MVALGIGLMPPRSGIDERLGEKRQSRQLLFPGALCRKVTPILESAVQEHTQERARVGVCDRKIDYIECTERWSHLPRALHEEVANWLSSSGSHKAATSSASHFHAFPTGSRSGGAPIADAPRDKLIRRHRSSVLLSCGLGSGAWGLGSRIRGLGSGVWGLGFGVWGQGWSLGLGVEGLRFGV